MTHARRALVPLAAFAGLLLHASAALAVLAPAPAAPWATTNARVLTIARVNGVVYVGGKFTQVTDTNGTVLARNHLAAISAADGHVLPWNPGANDFVRALTVSIDGKTLYIGGDFTTLGGAARSRLAAEATISPTSTTTAGTLRAWKPAADEAVYAITQLGGRVYLGGNFLHISGHGRPRLASVAASSGALTGWHPKADGAVRALLPSPTGSVIFAGGLFHHVNGANAQHLVAIDPASGALHPWKSHPGDSVLALAENSSYLYAGDKGGGGHLRSFMLNTGRMRWTSTTNGNVNAVALIGQGSAQRVVIGGHFTKVGAQERHKVALVNPVTGLVDTSPWHPAAAGSDLGIYGELAYGQKVYFGGDFLEWQTHPGVAEQAHLAVFSTTAPADTTPPVVKPPAVTIVEGATLGTAKVPLSLTWSASDPGSGVCRLNVQRRYGRTRTCRWRCSLRPPGPRLRPPRRRPAPTPSGPPQPTAPTTRRRSSRRRRSGSRSIRTRARPSSIAAAGAVAVPRTPSAGRCAGRLPPAQAPHFTSPAARSPGWRPSPPATEARGC